MSKALRWIGLIAGITIGSIGLTVAIVALIGHALAPPDRNDAAAMVGFIVGAVMFGAGWVLGMLSFPIFAASAGLLHVPFLVLGGLTLVVMAMVLGRADPIDIDGGHAARDAWTGAIVCFAFAIALSLNFALWLRSRGSRVAFRHVLHIAAVGYGALLFLSGFSLAYRAVTTMFTATDLQGKALQNAVALVGAAVLAFGPGAILLWHGASALTGVDSTRFRPPLIRWPVLAAVAAIGIGGLLLQADTFIGFMPLAHAVAMVAPGLALLALVTAEARKVRVAAGSTWREILLMIAYGAGVAATIAGIVNTFALIASFVVFLTAHGSFDGVQTLGDVFEILRNGSDELGQSGLVALLLLVVALLGPLNEEFWKGFGVRLLREHHPTRYRAFLWGLSSGIGFGMVEANEYSLAGLVRSPYRWWDTILLRGAASSLHALASGLVGIAWFYAFAGKRLRFFAFYFMAVGLHGSWNALNVLTSVRVLPWFKTFSDQRLEIVLEVLIGLLTLPILLMLRLLSRDLADEDLQPPASPPALEANLAAAAYHPPPSTMPAPAPWTP